MSRLILGAIVVFMSSLYGLSIFYISRERVTNPLVKFFCINPSSLKAFENSRGDLKNRIKTIIIVSMILNLITLLSGSIVILTESGISFWLFLFMSYVIRFADYMLIHRSIKLT